MAYSFCNQAHNPAKKTYGILFAEQKEETAEFSKRQAIIEKEVDCKYFITQKNESVLLRPSFPKKSILFKSKINTALLPKESIEVYISIPSIFQILTEEAKYPQVLTELDSILLPDAWFGNEDGESCYFLESDFIFDKIVPENKESNILCPVTLSNISEETLNIDKFILRVNHLNLYLSQENILVSDHVSIKFRGRDSESIISTNRPKQDKWKGFQLIRSAEMPIVEQIIKKSFDFIRSIY